MNAPRVTVCIRTFERPALLARAIGCVVEQSFEDWELIVVNNGGDPAPVDATVAKFASDASDRVRAVHLEQPVLIGEAANVGYRGGTGEFVTLLDDDDTWDLEYLAKSVHALDRAPEDVAAVACRVRRVWERFHEDGTVEHVRDESFNPNLTTLNFQSEFISHPISTNSLLIRRSAYDEVGGYAPDFETGDDVKFLLGLLARYRVEVIPEELGARHERVGSTASINMTDDRVRIRDNDARYRDEYTERPMRNGEISPAKVARAISTADRDNHARVDEALNHLREIRLHAGDTLHNAEHAKAQLDGYDPTFRSMNALLIPVVACRRAAGRLLRRGER